MGWAIVGIVVLFALMVVYAVKAIALLARGIVLVGVMLLRSVIALFR